MLTKKRVTINNEIIRNGNVLNTKVVPSSRDLTVSHYHKRNFSDQVYRIARDLSSYYMNHDDGVVYLNDIPDFDLHELASLIIASDHNYASEATGYDNPAYEKKMLPALTKYLADTTDKDNTIAFQEAWRDGVTAYLMDVMEELLNQEISDSDGYEGHWLEGAYL